jgi:hypothetical protein
MARYKVTKEQLERIVENFVMEASIESKKAPVKNMIPSQGAEAKKHVKNKMSGNMVDQSEGMPSVTPMKKKLSQAADAKKYMSKAGMKHTNKAGVMKEEEIEEGFFGELIGTKMNEKKATEIFEKRYNAKNKSGEKNVDVLAKRYNTDFETMKKALIKLMMDTGAEVIQFGGANAPEWNSEEKVFIKKGTKLGGPGGPVGG